MIFKKYRYLITWALTWSIFSIFLIVFFINVTTTNPIQYKSSLKKEVLFKFLPEGFAFFTRTLDESHILLYEIVDNKIISYDKMKHSSPKNLFGIKRIPNKILGELTVIYKEIKFDYYDDIFWNYQYDMEFREKINIDSLNTFECTNPYNNGILKGEFLLILQDIIPMVWANNKENIKMPAKAIRLTIK